MWRLRSFIALAEDMWQVRSRWITESSCEEAKDGMRLDEALWQGSCPISQGFPRRSYGLSMLERAIFPSISVVGQGCIKTLGNNVGMSRGCPCSRSIMFGKVSWVIFSRT